MAVRYGFRRRGDGDDENDLEVEELLELLADDFMEHGDLDEALDRLLRDGFTTKDGQTVEGLRELLERTRRRRRELEQQVDPEGALAQYEEWMARIEEMENEELDALLAEAQESGDERRLEVTKDLVDQNRLQQQMMGPQFNELLEGYRNYDFVSSEARESFEEMMEELRREVLETYFQQSKEFFENPDPEVLQRLRDMMDALSKMIEQDRAGEPLDPSFENFMERFGDFFPGAENLEDVLRQMAENAQAAEAMFNSLSPEQQATLRSTFSSMLNDMDLNFSLNRLMGNLRQALPEMDWSPSGRARGNQGGRFSNMAEAANQRSRLQDLEEMLWGGPAARALPEIDIDAVRRDLGDDAARHVERLQKAVKGLADQGFVDRHGNRTELTAKGIRQVGSSALKEIFAQLRHSPALGAHREASVSRGGDREETSKPWQPGEPVSLHLGKTLRNAVMRQGPGTPVRLHPDDFEVEEYESTRKAATVFAIDLSLSMAMRSNLVPAKKMVLALTSLIRSKFPRDFVAVVGFGETARELALEDIPALTIDYNYGTNLQHALALSRHLMRHEKGERQIVVVTDGEPTAHLMDNGEPFFSWPPVHETLQKTMAEVLRCTKAGITINTFALDIERSQFPFVEQIARVNGGRTFYVDIDNLGAYAVDDFVKHRRAV